MLRPSTADDVCREDLAGDELMVQGIDCSSVSPWIWDTTDLRFVCVVYICLKVEIYFVHVYSGVSNTVLCSALRPVRVLIDIGEEASAGGKIR